MPGMSAYQNLGKAFKTAGATGVSARKESIERQGSNLLGQEKDRQRQNLFNTLYQAIGAGANLYDSYAGNVKTSEYAQKSGYLKESNWLDNLLGTDFFKAEYTKQNENFEHDKYSAAEVNARELLGEDKPREEYEIPRIIATHILPDDYRYDPNEYLKRKE